MGPQVSLRDATPSGGMCPQAMVVTLIGCGTRRVLAARAASSAVSEQALWEQMVTTLQSGARHVTTPGLRAGRQDDHC
jgi:hypothetical protein